MSENTLDYKIVPSSVNPKLGLVVPLNPSKNNRLHSFYKDPATRRKDHILNHREGFKTFVSQVSPSTYFIKCRHLFHYLECKLSVIIVQEGSEEKSIVCDFPAIEGDVLNTFVNDDEFLYQSFIVHFHMNIMKQLLLFCENHKAVNLILNVDKFYYPELESYEGIASLSPQSIPNGKKVTLRIDPLMNPAHEWEKSMRISIKELQQEMWAEQKSNQVIKEYLRLNPFHDLFC